MARLVQGGLKSQLFTSVVSGKASQPWNIFLRVYVFSEVTANTKGDHFVLQNMGQMNHKMNH